DRARDRQQAEPDQGPRTIAPVAECCRGYRVDFALVRDDERRRGVDEKAGPTEEGEDDEADAEDRGVDVEVACEASADAGDHAVRPAALQLADLGDMCGVFAHGLQNGPARLREPSGMTLSRP